VHRQLARAAQVAAALDTLTQLGWIRIGIDGRYDLHPRADELAEAGDTVTTAVDHAFSAAQSPDSVVTGAGVNR
jgi:DNA-binding IclR family transcriptional regulator